MNTVIPITKPQLAERLGVSTRSLERWIRSGDLPPPKRLGPRRMYWHPEVIDRWLEKRLVTARR